MMLTAQDIENLTEGQRLLDEAYKHYFEHSDGYCKSGEGTVTITTENYFKRDEGTRELTVEVFSYVFGTSRRQTFGSTADFLEWAREIHAEEMAHDWSRDPFAEMSDEDWQALESELT